MKTIYTRTDQVISNRKNIAFLTFINITRIIFWCFLDFFNNIIYNIYSAKYLSDFKIKVIVYSCVMYTSVSTYVCVY